MTVATWPTHEFWAMGCEMKLWLDVDDISLAKQAFTQVEHLFVDVEACLTRFKETSELSALNRERSMIVSDLLWDVLEKALHYADVTQGLFDPTLGQAMQAIGYTKPFQQIEHTSVSGWHGVTASSGGWAQVQMDRATQTVTLPDDIELDFGGIGKGYTLQLAADILREYGPALLDGAGDIVAVGAPRNLEGWPVSVYTPRSASPELGDHTAFIWLKDAALATSGIDHRQWVFDGGLVHHIIDPVTANSALVDCQTITVCAPNIVDADVYATAALVGSAQIIPNEWGFLQTDMTFAVIMNDTMQDVLAWHNPKQIVLLVGAQ